MHRGWNWITRLLYVVPFVNICNNRGGGTFIMIVMAFFILMFLLKARTLNCKIEKTEKVKAYGIRMIVIVLIMAGVSFTYGLDNFDSIRFFCLFPFFVPIFLRIPNLHEYVRGPFMRYLRYLIVLITISIIVDFVLMNIGLLTMQPMYDERQYAYTTRPFGLFGQPSVNSSLLCLFYILHRTIVKRLRIDYPKDWLFVVVTVGCIVQGSGSGFISYAIVLLCKYGAKSKVNLSLKKFIPYAILSIILLVLVILSNKIDKLSLNYINELIEYTGEELWYPYLKLINSPLYLWFGMPEFPLSIDFGPLYLVGTVGLIYFIAITILCLSLYNKAKSAEMKMSIVLMLVGNLHYPVMFYFVMNVIWFFIIYIILVLENEKVQSRDRLVCV